MKILYSLYRWGTLYFLVGLMTASLFWEEKLRVKLIDHQLLAIGILIGSLFLLDGWIIRHPANFLVPQSHESSMSETNREE